MEIRQLKYFVTIAQTLNFSEAARKLYITQGTLSQQIQQLEFELGSQLFERSSHNVSLTEAGEELLPLAMETISASDACLTRMNDLRGALAGTLQIGAIQTFKGIVTDAARTFVREYPGVKVNLIFDTAENLREMLCRKEIDLALAYKSVNVYEDIESEELFRTSLHVIMRKDHPLAGNTSLELEQLGSYGILIPGQGLQARRSFDRFVGIDTRKMNVRMEVNVPDAAMDLVQTCNLLAISSPLPAAGRERLMAVPLENCRYTMPCCVHRLKAVYRKKSSELFMEKIRDSALYERMSLNLEK